MNDFEISLYVMSGKSPERIKYFIRAERGGRLAKRQEYDECFKDAGKNAVYLSAIIAALRRVVVKEYALEMHCDNRYVAIQIADIEKRASNDFRRKDGTPYKHDTLWRSLYDLLKGRAYHMSYSTKEDMLREVEK